MIIPFFIPDAGCSHQCVFCNQKRITGRTVQPDASSFGSTITEYLKTNQRTGSVEVAFYGGSFTALPLDEQRRYLTPIVPFIESGTVKGIRVSTRPDCIDDEILDFLQKHHVRTIELGAQSMDDDVLYRAGRGHSSAHTIRAAQLVHGRGFLLGLQLMAGLPGDSKDSFNATVRKVIELKPDFVRLYPLLVMKETPLASLYQSGKYVPLTLDAALALSRSALLQFESAGIKVIRIGLQSTEELEKQGTILAGPYHPAFRELLESSIMLNAMRKLLLNRPGKDEDVEIRVHPKYLSASIGHHRRNVEMLRKEFLLHGITITADPAMQEQRTAVLA